MTTVKKRLSREQKREQSVIDLINQMFIIAGHEVTYDDIKNRKDAWYQDWTMTEQQNDEWKEWGVKYLMKTFNMYKKSAEKEMQMICLMWGLKFDNYKNKNNKSKL